MTTIGGRAGIGGHHRGHRGRTNAWITPPHVLDALGCKEHPFDLDPCAHPDQPFETARVMLRPPIDGLENDWFGEVWLNPPYGPAVAAWMKRLARHGNGVALIFARTDTAWWHESVSAHARAVFFLRGRLNFYRPNGERSAHNAGGPSALVAFGEQSEIRLDLASRTIDGWAVRNDMRREGDA